MAYSAYTYIVLKTRDTPTGSTFCQEVVPYCTSTNGGVLYPTLGNDLFTLGYGTPATLFPCITTENEL